MIDLSHLTEEEQGTIMTVLRRDADLKKAEEERIGKLDKIMNSGSKMDAQWKYLTGEWFYEAKSRRHTDKIHGSEIILAAMKTNNTPFDASPRTERSKTQGSIDLDVAAPVKPARSFETLHTQMINRAGKEHHSPAVHSPRMPRQNPFNRISHIFYEAPENINIISTNQDKDSSETEPESPLKSHAAEEASQTSGGSTTSETSSSGFKPVPRKRTFVSRQSSSVMESGGPGLDAQVGSVVVAPAPRQRLRRGSSGSASHSHLGEDDMSQKSVDLQQLAQPCETPDENSQQPLLSNSILERGEKPPSVMRDRSLTDTMTSDTDVSTKDTGEKYDEPNDDTLRESEALNADILRIDSIQYSDRGDSVGTAGRQEELSLPQSTADPDPPVSYDLNFIDKSDGQVKKSNQKHVFKLTTQTTSPAGDEESIAKVLDWFTRSTDSSDWLRARDGSGLTSRSVKYIEGSKSKGEAEDVLREQLEKHNTEAKELSATEGIINKEVTKVQEVRIDSRERMRECEYEKDERQKPHVSHLRSFWERHKLGPKILIIKSMTPRDKVENTFDPAIERVMVAPDLPSQPGIYNQEGTFGGERQHLVISLQRGAEDSNHELSGLMYTPASADLADRRSSDSDILNVFRHSQDLRTVIPFERSVESQGVTLIKSYREADSISQSTETALQDQLSKAATMSQPDTALQTRNSPDPFSRNTPYVGNNQGGNDIPLTPETQTRRGRHKDKNWNSEDKRIQVSMSPKQNEDTPIRERSNSPHKNTQGLPHQEISAERIKQLKSFWEQDRKPMFYNSKPNPDWKISRGPSQAKINKRFTKSEYDLRSLENEEEDEINYQNVTVIPINQRNDKSAPSLGTSQFNTLRDFWDEATSNTKGSFEKPKRLKRKETIGVNPASKELECGEAEIHHLMMRPTVPKSPLQNQSKSPLSGKFGSGATNESSKDFPREEKSTKTPPSTGKEVRPLKVRKDSFETSSSRANSMRRAASMFAVCAPEENDQPKMDADLKLSQLRRQNGEKGATTKKSPEETGNQTPRARAYVPTDYRHYLGMTSSPSFHTSLTPTPVGKGSEGKTGYEFDLGGPVRASTPVSSEEHYSRRSSRISRRPPWTNYSSDTGQDSSLSSTSDSWSNSRNGSNYRNVDDTLHPVRKALRRAEIRPKNVTKSLEDLTAPPRRGTSQDRVADNRGISDPSPTPSPSSSPLMDRNRMRKMSTSVPMFEDGGLTDSNSDNSYHRGRLTMDNSFTNLTSSSGMSSLSGSVMTMYGGDFGNVEVQGGIQFSINYIQRLREFHIFVAHCQDLAAADLRRGRSDPYVKSYLVPDKSNLGKRKTSVKKKTLNPTFNEILRYRVHMDYLRTQMLILSVWHHDTFGRNSFLGEVDVDLSKWNFNHTQMNYLPLKARTLSKLAPSAGRGEMKLAIRYLPQITHSEGSAEAASHFYNGEIHIWVKECKNLPLIRATIDPYVKCFVLPDTSRKSRQKTRVVRRTVDPVFNHTMVYDGIRHIDLSEACVELTVWDRDRLTTNLLGGLRLGAGTGTSYGALVDWMDSTPSEVAFWERMKSKPNEWVEDTLPLRMMNPAKSSFK